MQADASLCFLCDQVKILRKNMAGKTLIEHPASLAMLPSELPSYAVAAMALPPRIPCAAHPLEGELPIQ